MKSSAFLLACTAMVSGPGSALGEEIHEAARAGDLARIESLIERDGGLVDAKDAEGQTPLHWAVSGPHVEVVTYLVEHGADVNAANYEEETPLHIAAANNAVDPAAVLVRAGADLESRNQYGRTPLLLCARERGGPEMTRLLLNAGAAIDAGDKFGSTSLELAAWRAKREVVDILLAAGATVPVEGFKATMLLDMAASGALDRLFDEMQAKGVDVVAPISAGRTLLHAAAGGGSAHIVGALVGLGLDAGGRDRYGWTPLHYASRNGRLDAVKILLERGADLNARTIMGQTPYNLAAEDGRAEVAAFLEEKGADRAPIRFPRLEGKYLGQKPPGAVPELFALGIVSSIWGLHSTIAFSPDGEEACWSAMVDKPGEIYTQGAIFMTRRVSGVWTAPVPAPFSGGFRNGEPIYSTDGSRLYFNSNRPLPGVPESAKERIWYVDRAGDGWSEPRPIDAVVNDQEMHWQFSVDAHGSIYFGSGAAGGLGMADIYCARLVGGRYEKPANLGSVINTDGNDHCPFIAPDGSYLIFSKDDNEGDLFVSFRSAEGAWTTPRSLGVPVNTEAGELCPIVTADGRYLFFLSTREGESHPYWVETTGLDALRPGGAGR